jgi:hypothetical protein
MEVKVQCECGTRFAFDVEPVNGRMPVRINCPGCGADRTDFANEAIRRELAAAAAVPPAPVPERQPMRVTLPPPQTILSAAAVSAAAAVLTAASTPPPPAAPPSPPAPAAPTGTYQTACCFRHPKIPAKETCRVCGKPICEECMKQYGYVCSAYCRQRAGEAGMDIPVYGKHRAVIEARMFKMGALIWRAAVLLVVILAGAWIWYTFFGSRPHVIYSEKLPHGDRARFYQLLAPNQLLSIKAGQMSLSDVARQKRLWSVPLNVAFSAPPPPDPSVPNIEEAVELYPEPRVMATTNDLWILFPGRLVQYDRRSGNSKQEIPINPPFFGLAESGTGITVISSDEPDRQIITRVVFAEGAVQTEPIESANPAALSPVRQTKPPVAALPSTDNQVGRIMATVKNALPANPQPAARENPAYRPGDRFVADGTNVVQMRVALIEHKIITHQSMKSPKKSLDENLTSGQSMNAAEQEMNEIRRAQTGGVEEEDVSRYQVTLRRLPAGAVPDWKGEVVGPPSFYPLKNLGVLVAGKTIQVFDRNNKKLWSANLTYSIARHYSRDFATESDPPCVEAGGTLYVFDQGMLTSFEAATGDVHWRLTSVGITQVQPDAQQDLYVSSTTASPDTIQFSQQVDFSARANPVILKVEAATGRVLWRNEGLGDTCFVTGKFVYLSKAEESPLITPGEDPVYNFDLYRLSPSDGHALWNYSQSRLPVRIEALKNEILIHFKGELQLLKFFSL